jgi:hypothetical protein
MGAKCREWNSARRRCPCWRRSWHLR